MVDQLDEDLASLEELDVADRTPNHQAETSPWVSSWFSGPRRASHQWSSCGSELLLPVVAAVVLP